METFTSKNEPALLSEPTSVGAIGKEFDRWRLEKIEVDQFSIQLLMGNITESALRLNAVAEAKKANSQEHKKNSSTAKWDQQLLCQLSRYLDQINELIEAIEAQIEFLRLEAQVYRDRALELFERADALEDILADGLQEHERSQAIALLRQSGHTENLEPLDLTEIAALLALQLQADRSDAATSYQKGEDCDATADDLQEELSRRKREAEELQRELDALDQGSHKAERLSEACLRLKEDLLALAPDSKLASSVRADVAHEKQQAVAGECYDLDIEEELKSLELPSLSLSH